MHSTKLNPMVKKLKNYLLLRPIMKAAKNPMTPANTGWTKPMMWRRTKQLTEIVILYTMNQMIQVKVSPKISGMMKMKVKECISSWMTMLLVPRLNKFIIKINLKIRSRWMLFLNEIILIVILQKDQMVTATQMNLLVR